jgi:hypothetical protein
LLQEAKPHIARLSKVPGMKAMEIAEAINVGRLEKNKITSKQVSDTISRMKKMNGGGVTPSVATTGIRATPSSDGTFNSYQSSCLFTHQTSGKNLLLNLPLKVNQRQTTTNPQPQLMFLMIRSLLLMNPLE